MEFFLGNIFFPENRYTLSVGREIDKMTEEPTQELLRGFPDGKSFFIPKV